jgi:serine/threonine protein kinase
MIGIKDPNVIYIVDFGLCKKYRSSKTGKHMLPRTTKKLYGTLKYCSVNALRGKEQSRRDDLISLGYVLIFLYKRDLPWISNYEKLNERTYFELVMTKLTNAGGDLFKNIPKELDDFVKYCEKLKFEEDPNYNYMKGFFLKILNSYNYNINKINFSWIDPNDKSIKSLLRRKSNSRNRILNNLENGICIKNKINSLE